MSTPAYVPPSVGPAGLTTASYASILADNLQSYLNIYGANQYVGPDSAIYQLLSIVSLKQADTNAGLQLAYNQASPLTAVGVGLDRVVKMNGLARLPFSYSTALVACVSAANVILTNAFVQDQNGNLWALPTSTPLVTGTTNVTVVCTTPGSVTAEVGTINIIATPTNGWTSVSNASAAVPGASVEADSALRARQAVSVALPSVTPTAATVAAILAVSGVTRVAPGYPTPGGPGTSIENPTGAVDSPWGNPAHSITMVVEGGPPLSVATTIYNKKTIGCFTNGTTSVVVTDPVTGYETTISYYQPSYVQPYIGMYVHGLSGFTSTTLAAIQTALVNYLNSLAIGEGITYSALYGAALAVTPNLSQPEFSIKSVTLGTTATGLFTVIPDAAGSGYHVGDVLTVAGGTSGTVTVSSINGTGGITGIQPQVTTAGAGYALATGVAVTGGYGTSATINVTAVQPTVSSDLTLLFYQAARGVAANVVVAAV
jgi:uncharacterized phage protein gp47/JayE